jgi:hypothetical protein
MGRITAVAPMCKRGLFSGENAYRRLIFPVTIASHKRSFVIIGSETGVYTARRGKTGEQRSRFNACSPCNSYWVRSHINIKHQEPNVNIHPPKIQ